jgi:hypothetical protein
MTNTANAYKIERTESDGEGYGKAGKVEWRVVEVATLECIEILPTRWQAKQMVDNLNKG